MTTPVDLEALMALLASRRSVRRFEREPPPRALVERILEAAILAPSASNAQPWRFFVVASRPTIERMAAAVRTAVDRIAAAIEPASETAFRAYGDYFTRFENAPLVVVLLHRRLSILSGLSGPTLSDADRGRIERMERGSGMIGTSLALENLLLAAHAAGLGASGMTGPLVAEDALRAELEVPASWEILALVPLGFPAETPPPTERKLAEKVTRWIL